MKGISKIDFAEIIDWGDPKSNDAKDEIIDKTDLPPTVCTDPHGHPPPPACSCSRICSLGLPSLVPQPTC